MMMVPVLRCVLRLFPEESHLARDTDRWKLRDNCGHSDQASGEGQAQVLAWLSERDGEKRSRL